MSTSNPLNTLAASRNYGNTGTHSIKFNPDRITGIILVPDTWVYDATDIASFITNLQADVNKAATSRIFPVYRLTLDKDDTKDTIMADMGYEIQQPVMEGKPDFTFKVLNCDVEMNNQLRQFNGLTNYKILLIDSNQKVIGTKTATAGEFTGFSLNFFWTSQFKFNDGKNPTIYKIHFSLTDPQDINERIEFVECLVNIEQNVKGIINAVLSNGAAAASKTAYIKAKTNQNGVDLYDIYGATLFSSDALWVVTDNSTGASVTPSSVTADPTTKSAAIVFASAGTYDFKLADPATLATAHVGEFPANGIETPDVLTVVVPT